MVSIARRFAVCFSLLVIAFAAAGGGQSAFAQIPYVGLFNQPRYAAIVIDANTGEVLFEKNADSARYPASITKVMTLYLTFEALQAGRLSLSDQVVISPHAAAQAPSKLGLRPGESIPVDEAIRAMTVKSANDIAVAMAEKLGGSEGRFAALMTLRAQELGMRNTQYVNASGLPDARQISSARDIAILSRALMRDFPQYYPYFSLRSFTFRGRVVPGHDHLLGTVAGVDGLKTGYTTASGFNLASSAVRDGRRIIGVVLGGSSVAARDAHMADLLQTSFDVIHRRELGERVTVAQNLFEPAPTGPILRPQTEEGDADQSGLKIVVNDDAERGVVRPEIRPAVASCHAVRTVKVVKGRHGRRTRVAEVSRRCEGAHVVTAADVRPCKARHGRHGHARCEAERVTRVSEPQAHRHGRHHGRATKVSYLRKAHAPASLRD